MSQSSSSAPMSAEECKQFLEKTVGDIMKKKTSKIEQRLEKTEKRTKKLTDEIIPGLAKFTWEVHRTQKKQRKYDSSSSSDSDSSDSDSSSSCNESDCSQCCDSSSSDSDREEKKRGRKRELSKKKKQKHGDRKDTTTTDLTESEPEKTSKKEKKSKSSSEKKSSSGDAKKKKGTHEQVKIPGTTLPFCLYEPADKRKPKRHELHSPKTNVPFDRQFICLDNGYDLCSSCKSFGNGRIKDEDRVRYEPCEVKP